MKDLLEILDALAELKAGGERGALATVVSVRGSAYRHEGAKLLITESGRIIGNISAGCLEGDVLESAQRVIEKGEPILRQYDLTSEDEWVWGFGLGCNGKIDVFIEPLGLAIGSLEKVREALSHDASLVIATLTQAPAQSGLRAGAKLVIFDDGSSAGTLGLPLLDQYVVADALWLLQEGLSRTIFYDPGSLSCRGIDRLAPVSVFADSFHPPPTLVIFGAGPSALPLLRYAKDAGFKVIVVDHRPKVAAPERFPGADTVILAHPEEVRDKLRITQTTYAALLSHIFDFDVKVLAWLLESDAPYVGLLGSSERLQVILENLRRQGYKVDPTRLERLYSPVGLDIGAEGPDQIALAIISEILAVKNRRSGTSLKDRLRPLP